jgi:hypothetical protein
VGQTLDFRRNWSRLTHPVRTARSLALVTKLHLAALWRLLSARIEDADRRRSAARFRSAKNVLTCTGLEVPLTGLDAVAVARHLNRVGCVLVRGNTASRTAVEDYRTFLEAIGFMKPPPPNGGGLWQIQGGTPFQFPVHRLVQQFFYETCRAYFESDILLSSAGTTATIRTVGPTSKIGLVPFHQDISPVGISRALTFWVAVSPDHIGREAPGLRFIASTKTRCNMPMAHQVDSSGAHEIGAPELGFREFCWTPEINVGDVMIFDPYVRHASYSVASMTRPRTSVDLRVTGFDLRQAVSYLDAGHGPILFDQTDMIAPARAIFDGTSKLEYDPDTVQSTALRSAFEKTVARDLSLAST